MRRAWWTGSSRRRRTWARRESSFPSGRVRDELGVKPRSLEILREAMLADVEDADGTGARGGRAGRENCGKTGTAQVMNERNQGALADTHLVHFVRALRATALCGGGHGRGRQRSGGGDLRAGGGQKIYTAIRDRERMRDRQDWKRWPKQTNCMFERRPQRTSVAPRPGADGGSARSDAAWGALRL